MTKQILLVEDNPSDEKLTLLAFQGCGVSNEIVVQRDGAAALEYLHTAGTSNQVPAVVLLDLKLPKIDGLEVLKRIRAHERTRVLPVVILTSSKEDEDVISSYLAGANAYVRKPVEFGDFLAAAQTLGLFWLLHNEPPPAARP